MSQCDVDVSLLKFAKETERIVRVATLSPRLALEHLAADARHDDIKTCHQLSKRDTSNEILLRCFFPNRLKKQSACV